MAQSDEILTLESDNPLWCAVVYIAVLAYPESVPRRDRAIAAMKALMIRAARRRGRQLQSIEVSKLLADMPVDQQNRTLNRLDARLHKRLRMGEVAALLALGVRHPGPASRVDATSQKRTRDSLIARGLSMDDANARTMKLRRALGPLYSLNDFARRWPSGAAKFKSDVWRPSVVHLALALHSIRLTWSQRDPVSCDLWRLLANSDCWVFDAIRHAEDEARFGPTLKRTAKAARIRLVLADHRDLGTSQ